MCSLWILTTYVFVLLAFNMNGTGVCIASAKQIELQFVNSSNLTNALSFAITTTERSRIGSKCALCKCGQPSPRKRIIGGTLANINDFPWQIVLFFEQIQICGGSLINDRYILTAAHCIASFSTEERRRMFVKLLSAENIEIDENSFQRKISRFMRHPRYNPITFQFDIALLRLKDRLEYKAMGQLKPICLPNSDDNFDGYNGVITGYGEASDEKMSQVLLEAEVPILSASKCNHDTDYRKYKTVIYDNMLCAGYVDGGVDHCFGDSGGPLHVLLANRKNRYYLAGVVSFAVGCANPRLPGVYTKVSSYLQWIEKNTQDSCYCLD